MPPGREAEARLFYVGVLGMREIPKPPHVAGRGGVWFSSGNVALHLGVDPDFRPATKAHPALIASNYDEFIANLERRGIPVNRDTTPLAGGRAHCYIADPFSNRIEIVEA